LLQAPGSERCTWKSIINDGTTGQAVADHSPTSETISESETVSVESPSTLTIVEKLRIIPSLLVYMIPLALVYLFEYFINQGLVSNMKLCEVVRFEGLIVFESKF
jgi:battenin